MRPTSTPAAGSQGVPTPSTSAKTSPSRRASNSRSSTAPLPSPTSAATRDSGSRQPGQAWPLYFGHVVWSFAYGKLRWLGDGTSRFDFNLAFGGGVTDDSTSRGVTASAGLGTKFYFGKWFALGSMCAITCSARSSWGTSTWRTMFSLRLARACFSPLVGDIGLMRRRFLAGGTLAAIAVTAAIAYAAATRQTRAAGEAQGRRGREPVEDKGASAPSASAPDRRSLPPRLRRWRGSAAGHVRSADGGNSHR